MGGRLASCKQDNQMEPMAGIMQLPHRPYLLLILDGWGYSESPEFNAIHAARTPNWDGLWCNYPHTLVNASGINVGLPDMQMGNSEVGHMNIGSGRVVYQDFTRITQAIEDGEFFHNEVLLNACQSVARNGRALHILGLLSTGGVHSHQQHIHALLELAKKSNVGRVYLHAFLDGRDTPPTSAPGYLQQTTIIMQELGIGEFASITGRYYAMDRNNNWDRTRLAYDLIMDGRAEYHADDALEALEMAYQRGETDEFVNATAISGSDGNTVKVEDGDIVIFANYRADRARQLSQAFTAPEFEHFARSRSLTAESFISMTQYKADFTFPAAFPPAKLDNVLGQYISDLGLTQLRIAETEKYAHVTFFLNGGEETVFANEDRILISSPDIATYDLKPEMSAPEVTDQLVKAISSEKYDVIICNYANPDMVGHTGIFDAAVQAIECIDKCIGRLYEAVTTAGGEMLITADHGNAEKMKAIGKDGSESEAHTAHTVNLVPLLYIGRQAAVVKGDAALCDIAPTLLDIMGLDQPAEMTGHALFEIDDTKSRAIGSN